ncbi:MAG TPA: glycine cleavage system protein GcvH [Candidatus Kapabacteria bacterium]|nr:glycine cleavage system protein GcvH [Candidatus Kapabacteria bacterium]
MDFPQNLKYTEDHEWIKIDGNIGTIGITEHAQGELGDIVYVDIPDQNANLNQGDSFGTIEAVKTVAELFSPISGKIIEVNAPLNDAPETVNTDPYGNGWIVKVELSNLAEVDGLMDAEAYKSHIGK